MIRTFSRSIVKHIKNYLGNMTEVTPPHLGKGSTDVPLQDGKLRLYSMRFCPYAQRIHLVLYAKDIPHDIVNINLKDKPDWFLAKFPVGKVPALHVEEEYIYESLIVADYLDEKYPQRPLLPKDPLRKAQDRLVIDRFENLRSLFLKVYFVKPDEPVDLIPILEKMDYFENTLVKRGTKFFSGIEPGMIDYMIWPWFERLDMKELLKSDNGRFKNLLQWGNNMVEDSAVKKHFCDLETHKQFIEQFKSGTADYDNILPKSRR